MSNLVCVYHKSDLDGKCSAALVRLLQDKPVDSVPMDYSDTLRDLSGRSVVMVDFSLQPFEKMWDLKKVASNLIWIDHHKTAIDASKVDTELGTFDEACKGLRRVGQAACRLTWEYYSQNSIPDFVELLSLYDVWDHNTDERALPFQYGMRLQDCGPGDEIWGKLLGDEMLLDSIIDDGDIVLRYQKKQNVAYAKAFSYTVQFGKYLALVCNAGMANSQLFDSVFDLEAHDLMLIYCRAPTGEWKVSLYSTKDDVDCGLLAKRYDGGGHKGAAGFQCDELPFNY